MSDEQEREDPRQHADDWEWLYQHGYLDNTVYGDARKLRDALQPIWAAIRPPIYWLLDSMTTGLAWLTRRLGR